MYDSQRTNGAHDPRWYGDLESGDERVLGSDAGAWPDRELDLIVVGGGMAGLSVAYHACMRERSVLVIERGLLGSGETGRTTAHISSALDDRYTRLERVHGRQGAQLAAASHVAAIDDIEQIIRNEGISCGFRRLPGYLFSIKSGRAGLKELRKEQAAAQRAGLATELVPQPRVALAGSSALRFESQADFHPLAYLAGLARAVARMGGAIRTHTRVVAVGALGPHPSVELADGRKLRARAVVVATNSPIHDRLAMHPKQAAYRSYVSTFAIPAGSVEPALYWDTGDPYHYVRLTSSSDELIVGGEDHRVGQSSDPEASFAKLETWTRERFPMARRNVSRWSGQILEPADGMAFIGHDPGIGDRVYIATGDSGNGITHGAIAGMLINDLIDGRDNPWAKLYEPGRKLRPIARRDFLVENAKTGLHYADWLLPGGRERAIERGEGAVVRRGLRRIAVYVDEAGDRFERSAMCPHLGCVVAWNSAERSWDCPCHGSRFDPYGKIMTGPAHRDLAQVEGHGEPAPAPARRREAS